ncbi:MAG: hypothetical protein OEY39_06285 [Candidatus Bathyarchaeota archaeon]|nr:hypothetical protein [Candidatus Bathyarchaeota archaeon]MDH5624060.1 hypothetical protein [Candidatus Bathyarchaeota archaeon]
MTSSSEHLSSQKLVRCWNCRHLKTVHQGEPREGRLFAEEIRRCDVHGMVFETHFEIVRERNCTDHIRVGLWETLLDARSPA